MKKTRDDKSVEFKVSLMLQLKLLPGAVNEMIASVADSGYLTESDRYGLMAAVLDDTLCEEERRSVNRLLRSVVKGRVLLETENVQIIETKFVADNTRSFDKIPFELVVKGYKIVGQIARYNIFQEFRIQNLEFRITSP